jgi:hypothetical protein
MHRGLAGWAYKRDIQSKNKEKGAEESSYQGRVEEQRTRGRNKHTMQQTVGTDWSECVARDVVLIVFAHGHGCICSLNIQEPYKFYKLQMDRWMDGRVRA